MNNSPCLGCKQRKPICHDSCMKYAAFKELASTIKEAKAEYNDTNGIYVESINRSTRKH